MDLSKLPKLSDTSEAEKRRNEATTPAPVSSQPQAAVPIHSQLMVNTGVEAWMSLAIGVILLMVSPFTVEWLISLVSSYKPPFLPITDASGNEIPYLHSIFFMAHFSIFFFSVALLVDGLVLWLIPFRYPVMVALVLTVLVIPLNLYYIVVSMSRGESFPILSGIAIIFGVYMLTYQWRILTSGWARRESLGA